MKNEYEVRGEVTAIFLKSIDGYTSETLIDTDDLPKVNSFNTSWVIHTNEHKYQHVRTMVVKGGKKEIIRLHRLITNAPKGKVVDHINHNTFDNRKSNLRVVTQGENAQNKNGSHRNSRSGVRGVYPDGNRWMAQYKLKGVPYYLGSFGTIEEAAAVVQEARKKHMPYSREASGYGS